MNVEQNRLDTFHEWPHDAAVSPARIAKAGFFYTNQGRTVECFSCHSTISEWNYGDQVMARHRSLCPSCQFVNNPTTSGNVPIVSETANVPSSSGHVPLVSDTTSVPSSSGHVPIVSETAIVASPLVASDPLTNEAERLQTFVGWPIPHVVTPQRLARAGFFYLHYADNTKCAFCKGVVRAWEPDDDPDIEHMRHFRGCPFVLTDIVPRLAAATATATTSQDSVDLPQGTEQQTREQPSFSNVNVVQNNQDLEVLGVQTYTAPKKPNFATLESRLRTFASWSPDLIQTPQILAQAGFYYEGSGDLVRCFHCDGGLRHWDPQDDPWTEHARWFQRCPFIILVRGQEFVNACTVQTNNTSNLEEVEQNASALPPPTGRREVSESELQEYMTKDVALSALSIGINVGRVKKAIRDKLERTGVAYSEPDALVEAALNLQQDEEDMREDSAIAAVVNSNLSNLIARSVTSDIKSDSQSAADNRQHLTVNHGPPVRGAVVSLEEENRRLREARLCKICMDGEVAIVFLPCGHLATCINCAPNLEDCPVCRSAIKATVRTFLS